MFKRLRLRKRQKDKGKPLSEKGLREIMAEELAAYIKREELQGYLEKIERDKRKKRIWDSMSPYTKIKLLRYVLKQKGAAYGKK